jgi:glyoxylase-like metal-dependent hydrolase (beta-lactamase superfamily II)
MTHTRPEIETADGFPTEHTLSADGARGRKVFRAGEAPYAELNWVMRHTSAGCNYDLLPGIPRELDRYVTRIIAPNPGVMTGPGTNTYLVGEKELAVIDPGPEDAAHLRAIITAGAGRIRWILCSHTHLDHAAATVALSKATGAKIAGMSAPLTDHDLKLKFERVLQDGDRVEIGGVSLRTVFTPGHASNQVCFLLENTRMLFTGDHVMQGSTVVIWPPDGNMAAYLGSLRRLNTLDVAILAPGHGYLIGNPQAEAERLIQHRLARESKVRQSLRQAGGSATLESLLPKVYDDVSTALHPIAARSLQAHLEKMIEDGEIVRASASATYTVRGASPDCPT